MTSLFTITRSPFEPWKHARRVWEEARRREFEVVVALDDRTSLEDARRVGDLADQVISWTSPGHCEPAYDFLTQCSEDFVLIISDDEEPSDLLWQFASEPPFPARFLVPVIPILGTKFYSIDCGFQERLVYRKGWRWMPRTLPDGTTTSFEAHSDGAKQVTLERNPGAVVWHYDLEAPREERVAKAKRYAEVEHTAFTPDDGGLRRLLFEDHPEYLKDLPVQLLARLPRQVPHGN